jgi:transcriptional regulator with XRE-family HTH domain
METIVQSPRGLGLALRDARKGRGLTQVQLARRAAVAQPTLSNVERGTRRVTLPVLLRILSVLQLDLVIQDRPVGTEPDPWDDRDDGDDGETRR